MRLPFLSLFMTSPFDGLQEHAEKVKECAMVFQQAIECYISDKCTRFEDFRQEVINLEHDADAIKRRIRRHLPKGTLMPIDKFQLFMYLKEQDSVLDSVKDTLDLISYRNEPGIPEELTKDFLLLVDTVMEPIETLSSLVAESKKYFATFSDKQREIVKEIVRKLRLDEHNSDQVEADLKRKILNLKIDPVTIFHMYKIVETIGSIADHAENTGDMMRAMIAK